MHILNCTTERLGQIILPNTLESLSFFLSPPHPHRHTDTHTHTHTHNLTFVYDIFMISSGEGLTLTGLSLARHRRCCMIRPPRVPTPRCHSPPQGLPFTWASLNAPPGRAAPIFSTCFTHSCVHLPSRILCRSHVPLSLRDSMPLICNTLICAAASYTQPAHVHEITPLSDSTTMYG